MIPMSDVDILTKKTNEIRSLRVFNAVLTILLIVGFSIIAFILIVSRIQTPEAKPNFDIVKNASITVPNQITAGETFEFQSRGEKLIAAPAEIRVQLICKINGTESIIQVGQYNSNRPKGIYDSRRSFVISITQKTVSSESCHLEFYAYYTLYLDDANGELRQYIVPVVTRTNTFKFTVPKDDSSNSVVMTQVIPAPINEQPQPTVQATPDPVAVQQDNTPVTMQNPIRETPIRDTVTGLIKNLPIGDK